MVFTVPVTDDPLPDGSHRYYCPYCKTYLCGKAGEILSHKCPEAGFILIFNGHLWVGVPEYLKEEKENKR